ncbi:MAG: GntR family transcriptional regulator [Anaerolineae bacterium]|nr:GntR family transcriptional regulator [Anaerolineae bacterium]
MSQTIKALIQLRELILNGELQPGERLLEVALVEHLSVSRTPIRAALARLAQEGLLEKMPNGGYAVREFTERDIHDAIAIRGELEGMAARLAAERGADATALARIKKLLSQFDGLLLKTDLVDTDLARYFDLNHLFHSQLVALADSFMVERTLEHVLTLPFASPNALVMAQAELGQAWKVFFVAQEQHKNIIKAIENREGARADALAQEHAYLSLENLQRALNDKTVLSQLPAFKLVATNGAEGDNR